MDRYLEFVANHPFLFAALIGVIAFIVVNEIRLRKDDGLPPRRAVRLINDEDPLIIDLREPDDYARGHIVGARNIPADRLLEADARLPEPGRRPLLLYDRNGLRAAELAKRLRGAGHRAHSLRGGLQAWLDEQLPITR